MKSTDYFLLMLCIFAGSVQAQNAQPLSYWTAEQQTATTYQVHSQTQFVQQRVMRTTAFSNGTQWSLGLDQRQSHVQTYADLTSTLPTRQQAVVVAFATDMGSDIQLSWSRDDVQGEIQQQRFVQARELGAIKWLVSYEHARMLDQQKGLQQWLMGVAWQGPVRTQLVLAQGDDVLHYAQGRDTRVLLDVEKTFDF